MNIYILGTSGTAHEIGYYAKRNNHTILGYVSKELEKEIYYEHIPIYTEEEIFFVPSYITYNLALGIGMNSKRREEVYLKYPNHNYPNIVDPTAVILSKKLGGNMGNIISTLCYIQPDVEMGNFNYIQVGTGIGHNTKIGNFLSTGMGTQIGGNCIIGDRIYIGSLAFIKHELKICNDVIIGAGAIVVKDITEPGTYVGNPLRRIK